MSKMRAIDAAVLVMRREGVDTAFGIPGAAINPLYSALKKVGGIDHVLARHVEGASHMAEGYTRTKAGNIGVCIGTSGPAGTDMVTGLYFLTLEKPELPGAHADATEDHQWIHVDPERAKVESPFHSTIAHGYLTLSLLPHLWNQIIEVNNLKMMINYGMDKMKFGQPVLTGQSIRLIAKLQTLTNLRGVAKAEIKFTIEIKDQPKKALEGIAIFLYYFN